MKNAIPIVFTSIAVCLALALFAGSSFAGKAGPEQKPGLYLLSRTDATKVQDEVLAGIYRLADTTLMDQVMNGLASRDINVVEVKSEQEIPPDSARFILVVKIEEIELGRKRPFGRTARVKVSYAFQNRDRFELVRRTDEETSVQQWQNCIDKIGGQIVTDTSSDLAKYASPEAADKGGKSK